MRSFSFIVALLFALVTSSYAWPEGILAPRKGGKNNGTTNGNSVNKACRTMSKLTHLTALAANQTKLDALVAKGKLNQTEVEALKAKAANATTELQTMQANTTLVTECAVIDAHQKVVGECKAMKKLANLANLANNQTAMDAFMAKKKLNDTQMAKLEEKIGNATTKLKALQANTTLTDLCAQQQKANSGGASASSSATQAQSTGGTTNAASGLTVQSMPYLFVPLLAGIFATFL
ncbi:uncharacterized protein BDR25DRAFT_309393 [Lindgomyces ingoldianus]|uniref:Uncharacterized protein n=1 Tax=Lindgomyces ingoldianus TaxID=673940 RepID=A0ACB6RCW6_9PLEO|nr:uncharacterized protein BDR25DRAFT_309393 [Lindgomyces ingoldianus]KAF2477089.1 hypothetical protein BDR25DRAFT_309393 [Lindgomyces ingoldianus]